MYYNQTVSLQDFKKNTCLGTYIAPSIHLELTRSSQNSTIVITRSFVITQANGHNCHETIFENDNGFNGKPRRYYSNYAKSKQTK